MDFRDIIREEVEKIVNSDNSFFEFLKTEYGENPIDGEVAEAIISWSLQYENGMNDGDFETVSEYMNNRIAGMVSKRASDDFYEKLTDFVKNERNG